MEDLVCTKDALIAPNDLTRDTIAVVKAVDEVVNRKRKADKMSAASPSSVKTSGGSSSGGQSEAYQLGMLPPDIPGNDHGH